MRSDYEWVWNGELLRFVIDNAAVALVGVALVGFQYLPAELPAWAVPLALAGSKVVDFIRGRLPAKDEYR